MNSVYHESLIGKDASQAMHSGVATHPFFRVRPRPKEASCSKRYFGAGAVTMGIRVNGLATSDSYSLSKMQCYLYACRVFVLVDPWF